MSFSLEFETDNDAFAENPEIEISRILHLIADKVHTEDGGFIRDANGNQIGTWDYTPTEKDEDEPQPSARGLSGGTIIAQNEDCVLTSFLNGGAYVLTNTTQSREVFVQDEDAIRFRAEYSAYDAQSANPLAELWALYSDLSQEIG